MAEPTYTIIDGIAYYKIPYTVHYVDFTYEHLDCNSIIRKGNLPKKMVDVIAFATAKEFNKKLREIYNTQYKQEGYVILRGIDSAEVNSIDLTGHVTPGNINQVP